MTVNYAFKLQKAIYETLSGDSSLSALVSGVFNHVPQDSSFPYIVIGEAESSDYSTVTTTAEEVMSTVLVFSRARGSKEALTIMGEIKALLHQASLSLTGCTLIYLRMQGSNISQVKETLTWQGTLIFKALIEEMAS